MPAELPDRVVVDVDALGAVAGRYLVAADGMWSPVRKALGLATPGYLGEWHAFRQYFDGVTGSAAHRLWVWFEPDLLPGYAWSFPLPGGQANVGFGVQRDGDRRVRDMKALWPELLARPHIAEALGPSAVAAAPHKAWPIPARIDQAVLARGRVLFVGDAAGACDPLTGEGIGQALLTGTLAARAILDAGALQPELAASGYRRAVAEEWLPDHRMAALLSRALRSDGVARGGHPTGRGQRLDTSQLRPLAVRGRAPRRRRHPPPLAPPFLARPGAYAAVALTRSAGMPWPAVPTVPACRRD